MAKKLFLAAFCCIVTAMFQDAAAIQQSDLHESLSDDDFSTAGNLEHPDRQLEYLDFEDIEERTSSYFHQRRFKRQSVPNDTRTLSDYNVTSAYVSQSSRTSAALGFSYTLWATLLLPPNPTASLAPTVNVEVYGFSSLRLPAGYTMFTICDTFVDWVGMGVVTNTSTVPLLRRSLPAEGGTVSGMFTPYYYNQSIPLGEPYGGNTNMTVNSIRINSTATFVQSATLDGQKVSAYIGFDYGLHEGALVRNHFPAVVASRVDATTAQNSMTIDPSSTTEAPNGSYAIVTVMTYITRPMSNLTLRAVAVADPPTASDEFNIANAHVRYIGPAFGCMVSDGGDSAPYPMTLVPSSTKNTMVEARKDLGLVYSAADVGVTDTDPQYLLIWDIVIAIASTALNGQKVKINPYVSFQGDAVTYPNLGPTEHIVTVKTSATPLSNTVGATAANLSSNSYVYIYGQNNVTRVFQQGPGGVVPYRVVLNLRGLDYVDYHLRVTNNQTNASICLARLVRRGYSIPWTEPLETDVNVFYSPDRRVMDLIWGRIRNTKQVENDTSAIVELEVVTSVPLDVADQTELKLEFAFIVNGAEVPITRNCTLQANLTMASSDKPEFTLRKAWDPLYWSTLGAASVDLQISLPPGAPLSNLTIDIGSIATHQTRVCRAELSFAGFSLPCALGFTPEINKGVTYYKSDPTFTEENRAVISLGTLCADAATPANETENDLILNIVLEQPYGLDGIVSRPTNFTLPGSNRIEANVTAAGYLQPLFSNSTDIPITPAASPNANNVNILYPTMKTYLLPANPAPGSTAAIFIEIQTPPQSSLSLKLDISSSEVGLCKAMVADTGHSLPCLVPFEDIHAAGRNLSWTMNSWAIYGGVLPIGTHGSTVMFFPRVTNVGRLPMDPADTPNPVNVFKVMQTVQIDSATSPGTTKSVSVDLKSMDGLVTYSSKLVPIVAGNVPVLSGAPEANIAMVLDAGDGNSTTVMPGVMKIFFVTIVTHSNMLKKLKLVSTVDTPDAASLCSAHVLDVGLRMPCLNASTLVSSSSSSSATQALPDSVTLDMGLVCNQQEVPIPDYSTVTKESSITIAVGIVPNKNAAPGSTSTIRNVLTVTADGLSGTITEPLTFTVDSGTIATALSSNTSAVQLSSASDAGMPVPDVPFTEKAWIPFNVTVPAAQIYNLTLRFSGYGEAGRAAVLITGVRITRRGRNMLCCGSGDWNSSVTYHQTLNRLQNDSLVLSLGIVRNPGYSYIRGDNMDEDDIFTVEVEVEPTDHPVAHHGVLLPITLEAEVNGVLSPTTSTQNIRLLRTGFEQLGIAARGLSPNATLPYPRLSEVPLSISFSHSSLSTVEPLSITVRYFLPPSAQFNGSFTSTSRVLPTITLNGDVLEFEFSSLLLGEQVNLEIKLIADPDNVRGYGAGLGEIVVPYEVYGQVVRRFGLPDLDNGVYPENGVDIIPLVPLRSYKFYIFNEECYLPMNLWNTTEFQPCQFSASSHLDSSSAPSMAPFFNSSGWQADIREGKFIHWLTVDFGKLKRVTKIKFGLPSGVHCPKIITVEHSFTGSSWQAARQGTFEFAATETWPVEKVLPVPFKARFMRLRIVSTHEGIRVGKRVGLFVESFGCDLTPAPVMKSPANLTVCRFSSVGRTATDVLRNRHFAVDTAANRAFYCDLIVRSQEMRCYASSPGQNEWRLLPLSLTSVLGYQPSKGRTYFMDEFQRAIVHTTDGGVTFGPTSSGEFAAIRNLAEFVPSRIVSAKLEADVPVVTLGSWTADYTGIKYGSDYFIKWTACCSA